MKKPSQNVFGYTCFGGGVYGTEDKNTGTSDDGVGREGCCLDEGVGLGFTVRD